LKALALALFASAPESVPKTASDPADESVARASSVLEPAAEYAPARVADGDPLTAWCEGAPGNGKGQWVEVDLTRTYREGEICTLDSISVLPGRAVPAGQHAKGRPTKIRVSACGGDPPFVDRKIPGPIPDASTDMAFVWLRDKLEAGVYACLRITILAARDNQTCISEIVPRFSCAILLR
jgi:hypothetical protein